MLFNSFFYYCHNLIFAATVYNIACVINYLLHTYSIISHALINHVLYNIILDIFYFLRRAQFKNIYLLHLYLRITHVHISLYIDPYYVSILITENYAPVL